MSLSRFTTSLQAGPNRRELRLFEEAIDALPSSANHALIHNAITLIDSGHDLALLERSAAEACWLNLGRLAIGRVIRAPESGPAEGDWIFWRGPHADFAALDVRNDLWVPVVSPDPLLLPAGIGVEAEWGMKQAIERLGGVPDESLVLGQGMLGHLAAQWLKFQGSNVTVVENSPKRLEFSRKSGLKQKIDTHNFDWMERLQKGHPNGVKLLVDATGAPNPIESLMPMMRDGSVLCLLGQWRSRPLSEATAERMKSLSGVILGPVEAFGDADEHRAMLAQWLDWIREGKIPTKRLLTHHIPPSEGPVAMKRFAAGIRSWQGAVIHWNPDACPIESPED